MLLLNGKLASQHRLQLLKSELAHLGPRKPGLWVVRVGNDPASELYVKKKIRTCHEVGIRSEEIHLSSDCSQDELLHLIQELNAKEEVDGILVQLPLPAQIDTDKILDAVSPDKDVDGFHTQNLGRLVTGDAKAFVACTPLGVMNLLEYYKIPVKSKLAVVMGRSRIVGRPLSLLLDQAGATVCVVHSGTPNPQSITQLADILIVAIGRPQLIGRDYVKKSAVVVDVGTHRVDGRVVGDTRSDELQDWASALSPVPGGVGPMTICSLLENCVLAYKRKLISK